MIENTKDKCAFSSKLNYYNFPYIRYYSSEHQLGNKKNSKNKIGSRKFRKVLKDKDKVSASSSKAKKETTNDIEYVTSSSWRSVEHRCLRDSRWTWRTLRTWHLARSKELFPVREEGSEDVRQLTRHSHTTCLSRKSLHVSCNTV